jgi:hypothetical protein
MFLAVQQIAWCNGLIEGGDMVSEDNYNSSHRDSPSS